MSQKRIYKAIIFCVVLDAVAGALIAARGGDLTASLLLSNTLFGAALGAVCAFVIGWAIARLHSIGYILSVGGFVAQLVLVAYLATETNLIVQAATLAVAAPLYGIAAIVTSLQVKPIHPDR